MEQGKGSGGGEGGGVEEGQVQGGCWAVGGEAGARFFMR